MVYPQYVSIFLFTVAKSWLLPSWRGKKEKKNTISFFELSWKDRHSKNMRISESCWVMRYQLLLFFNKKKIGLINFLGYQGTCVWTNRERSSILDKKEWALCGASYLHFLRSVTFTTLEVIFPVTGEKKAEDKIMSWCRFRKDVVISLWFKGYFVLC